MITVTTAVQPFVDKRNCLFNNILIRSL